ncbi:response regulator [Azospirillum halopraeferens]|uniref:response regulator n=1 Tax=Azospirillum halopraeferens TaxID=34010 RepID=UPI0004157E03|nr:response regulator [Azospirillum halopraeferens]
MKTILLVEDEFGIAGALSVLLEDEGYRVFTAANGRDALDRLGEVTPDLVVTDFMMPLMDGAALGRTLRSDPARRHIPILMMSAVSESALRDRFDGYDGFLRKPFPIPQFFDAIHAILKDGPS